MIRVLIPYSENYPKSILAALSSFKEYSDLKMDVMGKLMNRFMHEKQDIYYDVPSENLSILLENLKTDGFAYELIEDF